MDSFLRSGWVSRLLAVALGATLLAGCKPHSADDDIRVETVPKEAPAAVAGGNATMAAGPTMAGMTALPGMTEFVAATPTPQWSPPAGWIAQPPNPVRKGTWLAPGPAGAANAEVTVNVFAGQLGGLLANVNRWCGQVGLSPDLTEDHLGDDAHDLTIGGRAGELISLDGSGGQSLEGAFVFLPDRVWSFRMIGPTATIAAQRANFRAFLDSVQWQDTPAP
jgi:hypothetical protein